MAARAFGSRQKQVDDLFVQNDAVSLCFLVNRRARTMRIIDFRAGPSSAKRAVVDALAQREGIEKVYTLVERDEVQTWLKLGFAKEGNIPCFYKRSDAFLLGSRVPAVGAPRPRTLERRPQEEPPFESEMRLKAAPAVAPESPSTAAHDRMERTIAAAKRTAKLVTDKPAGATKVTLLSEPDARKAVSAALRSGRALTAFEPFGRDVERRYFVLASRSGPEIVASTESQLCFGNAFIELLQSPKADAEKTATIAGLRALCDALSQEGIVSGFALAPSDDVTLAFAYLQSGFRRTGLLMNHMAVGGKRRDAIIWSRKLAPSVDG